MILDNDEAGATFLMGQYSAGFHETKSDHSHHLCSIRHALDQHTVHQLGVSKGAFISRVSALQSAMLKYLQN